jgi:DNA-binding transcriptional MerR regulator/methylmalonyl-CoA mutase cobalamin-binding subunit
VNDGRYRIGTLASLTGVTTHAIRVWERRYQAFSPARSAGGARLYTDDDVQRLRLIKRLLSQGYTISQVAKLDMQELGRRVQVDPLSLPTTKSPEAERANAVVEELLSALVEMDLARAGRTLAQASNALTPHDLVLNVLGPTLEQLGTRWASGTVCVASEHAATAMLRTHLGVLLAAQEVSGKAPIVCGTPVGERHELGALMAAVVMAMHGRRVLYLGADLPASELAHAARLSRAWAVALSVVGLAPDAARHEIEELCLVLPSEVQVWVGGRRVPELHNLPARVLVITSLLDMEDWLLDAAE